VNTKNEQVFPGVLHLRHCSLNDSWFLQPSIPHALYKSVNLEVMLYQSNRVSAIKRVLFYYRHVSIFVFFHVCVCCLLLPCILLSLLRYVWEWRRYTIQHNQLQQRPFNNKHWHRLLQVSTQATRPSPKNVKRVSLLIYWPIPKFPKIKDSTFCLFYFFSSFHVSVKSKCEIDMQQKWPRTIKCSRFKHWF